MNDTFERVVKTVASYEHNGERVIIHDLDETFYGDRRYGGGRGVSGRHQVLGQSRIQGV